MNRWWPAAAAIAVVLGTTLIGLLSNWSKERPKVLATPGRYRMVFTSAVVAMVGLAVIQAVNLVPQPESDSGQGKIGNPAPPGQPPSASATPSSSFPPGPTANDRFLDQLPVDVGAGNIQRILPRPLDGKPGYDHPLVIACPTDPATDQFRDVRYALFKRYVDVKATVYAYTGTPDESRVQVRLYRDNQPPVELTLVTGKSQDLEAGLVDVDTLVIRVTCENPKASAILAGARLQHQ